jgi:hypothetical protein
MRNFKVPTKEHYHSDAAKKWLQDHYSLVNAKWKHVELQYHDQSRQQFHTTEKGDQWFIVPAHYTLRYYRYRFRFFGQPEKAELRFAEEDVHSIGFFTSRLGLWDAFYQVQIILQRSVIDILYSPPLFGAAPLANARHSEEVSFHLDLDLRPTNPPSLSDLGPRTGLLASDFNASIAATESAATTPSQAPSVESEAPPPAAAKKPTREQIKALSDLVDGAVSRCFVPACREQAGRIIRERLMTAASHHFRQARSLDAFPSERVLETEISRYSKEFENLEASKKSKSS